MTEFECWQVTKYNPAYRNELGHYMRDEWTGFGDIGQFFDGRVFTPDEYLRVESVYVEAMCLLAEYAGVEEFEVDRLGIYPGCMSDALAFGGFSDEPPCIDTEAPVRLPQLPDIGRLLLRDAFWCVLRHPHLELRFYGDYYLMLKSDLDLGDAFRRIEQMGLFVELTQPSYFLDED